MDYLYGFASSISKDLLCGAVNQLRYPCCFNNFVEQLAKEEGNLIATRDSVQNRVAHAKKQTRKTSEVGDKWLKDANIEASNVNQLLKEARIEKSFCFGHCPNWFWRYRIGKKLANRKGDIEKRIKEGRNYIEFESVATLPSGTHGFLSERCLNFESRQPAYEQLMEALKDDEVTMIGLYGMGGCGKTTLAMEIRKKAEAEQLFDEVIFVPVSSTVEVRRIQEKIASSIQYTFPENEELERAQRLYMRLTQENKILVVLDDVWEKLDFGAIGIPSVEHHKGCKVLITTRSEEVCTLMDCQKKIQLPILTDEEAWTLFQKQAHIFEGTSDTLKHLGRKISDECKGLPVAIAAVASSLKGKAEVVWRVALNRFTGLKPLNIGRGLQNPYTCLQLSYDNLDTEEAKSLFLLCSVFPEDSEIPVELLTRFAIGLGVVGDVHSYEEARNEVIEAKIKLLSSCLLLGVDDKSVQMHDLVRHVARRIAKDENKIIECALEQNVTLEHNSMRYLCCEKIPNELDCTKLEFLYLYTNLDVPNGIFKGMRMLRVLFLYNKGRRRRPLSAMSFKSLTNLRCILLRNWELGDISFLGDVKKLESLTLHNCLFLELPDVVVTQLKNLRLLDLSECDMKHSPFEVIGRHPQLEELYFVDHRSKWDFYNEHTAEFFQKFRVPQVLQRYHIHLGIMFAGFQEEFPNRHRTLFLSYLDPSNAAVKDLAKKAEVLCLANIEGSAKNILPDIFQIGGGMDPLIELLIRDSKIECLIDTSHHLSEVGAQFSNLHWLRIEHMKNLGALYHGSLPPIGHFEKLQNLHLSHCPKLTWLFTHAVAQNMVQLEKLEIASCLELKHLVTNYDDREEISTNDKRLLFPKLKRLHVRECDNLEYLIPITYAQGLVQLECLEIVCNNELKYLFGQCTNGDHLVGQDQNELNIELTSLKELTLIMLPEMISICPEVYLTWPSLRQFSLQNCPGFYIVSINTCLALHNNHIINEASQLTVQNIKEVRVNNCELEVIFQLAELNIDGKQDPLTSCLEMLYLENLPQLRFICKGDLQSRKLLQNLQQMEVTGCKKLKAIFSACISGGLPQLKELKIENCYQLQQIIEDTELQNSGPFNLPNLTRLTLKSCPILGSLFTTSTAKTMTSLEELMIEDCRGLVHILTYGRAHTNKKEEMIQDDHGFQSYVPMFPSLKKLSILRCNLLEKIFPISFPRGLGQLETIEIRDTPELRHVFGQIIHSSHQYQNKFQIEFPVLENVALRSTQEIIDIYPENYSTTQSPIDNLMVDSEETDSDHSSKMDSRATCMMIKPKLVSVIIDNSSKVKDIFHLEGFPTNGQEVTSCLDTLKLFNLPELTYVWTISKHFVSPQVQHLRELHICNCPKLKAIFSVSISRVLPLLKILVVEHCEELEHIIEDEKENENVSNPQAPKVCFSQLKFLLVTHCNNLKHLFFISISHEFPELEYLILNQNSRLVQVFESEAGVREGRVEILLPKLKHVVLMQQPDLINFCQGIEFQIVINLLVHNCPKFSLTSTTTVEDMLQISNSDKEIHFYLRPHLLDIRGILTKGKEVLTLKKESKGTQDLQSLDQKLPPNLIDHIEETKTNIIGKVSALAIPTPASILSRRSFTSSATHLYKIPLDDIEDIVKDIIQDDEASSDEDTVPDSQVIEQGYRPNEHRRQISPCQKIQNVDDNVHEGTNFVDKEGEIGVVYNDNIMTQRNEEPKKEFVTEVSTSDIPGIEASLSNLELVERPSPSYLDVILYKTHPKTNGLMDGKSMSKPCLVNHYQQKPLGEIESTVEIPKSEISGHSQTDTNSAKESEGHPINILEFMANDLKSLFQPVEENGEGLVNSSSITEDNHVVHALADLERCLKMPLKDIATSETNSILLLTALNFLSNLPLEDVTLPNGLKDIIDFMHKEFPSILCSFRQAFATTDKLVVLEARGKEEAITLACKISDAKNFMDEALKKEAVLKERVIRLKKEIKDCEADLSSLQEEKKKCIAETMGYQEEFENMRKDKSQMVEDQRKVRQELFELGYKWSTLCSRFEHNRIVAGNLS